MTADNMVSKTELSELPDALLEEILVRLSIELLVKLKIVSKRWLSLISQAGFAFRAYNFARPTENTKDSYLVLRNLKHHLYKKIITPISVSPTPPRITRKLICQSCNFINSMDVDVQVLCPAGLGIYCVFEYRQGNTLLLNPTTRESRVLPKSPYYSSCGIDVFHFAITDYDACRNKVSWKVGRVTSETTLETEFIKRRQRRQLSLSLELYSSETNSWKFIPKYNMVECYGYDNLTTSHYAILNGRVHWMIGFTEYISSFDYKNMVFEKIGIPRFDHYKFNAQDFIVTLFDDKYLCLILLTGSIDIWVMREYGVEDSWTKVCTLEDIHEKIKNIEVLGYSSKAQCLFVRSLIGLPTRVAIRDCNSSNIELLHLPGEPRNQFIKIVELSESLFSLSHNIV